MRVGRKRTIKTKWTLPTRVYFKRNKFWFVPKEPELYGGKKWINLGSDYHAMLMKHKNLTSFAVYRGLGLTHPKQTQINLETRFAQA